MTPWLMVAPAYSFSVSSPTRRNPKIFWTPQRQFVWNQMAQDYRANPASPATEGGKWFKYIKGDADKGNRYADFGRSALLIYQMTGDPSYARKAWETLLTSIDNPAYPGSRNETRETFIEWVWRYDWLYPALTSEERAKFIAFLNRMGDLVTNQVTGKVWGTNINDSDETVGHYFGVALLAAVTAADNPRSLELLNHPLMGNYAAPASSPAANARDAIHSFIQTLAKGGAWIESSGYNPGTLQLLLMGTEGLKTATGVDYFPEMTQFLPEAAKVYLHELTPDLLQRYQWGDDQDPRQIRLWGRGPCGAMLAGLLQNHPLGPSILGGWKELRAANPQDSSANSPTPRMFYFYNPYAPVNTDWRASALVGRTHFASGQGLVYSRTGWSASDSFIGFHFPNYASVHHAVPYFGDFQLYRQGEWAVTHPIGYATGPEADNGMLVAGFGSAVESRGTVAYEAGRNNEYLYAAGTTAGSAVNTKYYSPPPTFLHEWTRSLFYLPTKDKTSDTLVVFDRVHAKDPRDLAAYDRYSAALRTRIESQPALKQWLIHPTTAPTVAGNRIEWTTAKGQKVRVEALLPAARQTEIDDEQATGLKVSGQWEPGELHYTVRMWPAQAQAWDTFLNVISTSNATATVTSETVRSVGGEAQGALIHRPGQTDTLVMFSAKPGDETALNVVNNVSVHDPDLYLQVAKKRLITQGYFARFTAATATTRVYLTDLLPSSTLESAAQKQWTVTDGETTLPLQVSDEGVGEVEIVGLGDHLLSLSLSETYSIEGEVRVGGVGLSGIVISGGGKATVTDVDGQYKIFGLQAGKYSINANQSKVPASPTNPYSINRVDKGRYSFSPPLRDVTIGPSQKKINFEAIPVEDVPQDGGGGWLGWILTLPIFRHLH